MKTTCRSIRFVQHARLTALAIALVCGVSVSSVEADYIVTLQQVGSTVVATGSGAFDLTGLTSLGPGIGSPYIAPSQGLIQIGTAASAAEYTGFAGPTSFGSGGNTFPSSSSGDFVAIAGSSTPKIMSVPQAYVSGQSLSDTMTFNIATFASLGVTPGTYTWTWGTGVHADSFTLQIGPAAGVPDSSSTFGLLFLALITLFGINRFRACRLA
jgi:hypothetical protein